MDLEHSIVGWDALEADVCVPACGRESTHVAELVCETTALLLLLAANDTDLVAQLASFFCQGMDMES